ncbi:hypothetical protein JTB14_034520 [Gonioctena quinquepunctata]|nr:hypothetical protein JTB14_034520 [Gonioctena quinquepunctata]
MKYLEEIVEDATETKPFSFWENTEFNSLAGELSKSKVNHSNNGNELKNEDEDYPEYIDLCTNNAELKSDILKTEDDIDIVYEDVKPDICEKKSSEKSENESDAVLLSGTEIEANFSHELSKDSKTCSQQSVEECETAVERDNDTRKEPINSKNYQKELKERIHTEGKFECNILNEQQISNNLLQEKVKRLDSDLKLEKSKNADLEIKYKAAIQTNVDTNKVDSRKNWSVINQQNLINNNVNKDKKGVTAVTTQPSTVSIQGQEPSVSTSFAAVIQKKKKEINNESRPIISSKQVSEAVLEAKSKTVLNNLIHIEENTENESAHFRNGAWSQVNPRKKRKFLVGKTETPCNVETVPKMVSLHVTRLKPETKPEELEKFLEGRLEGVSCETHLSKMPDLYASMKVCINCELLKTAWKREIWPSGALVSFFRKKWMATTQLDPRV